MFATEPLKAQRTGNQSANSTTDTLPCTGSYAPFRLSGVNRGRSNDHAVNDQTSILRSIEDNWNEDNWNLGNFDFTRANSGEVARVR